jgi:hypothetical protein
VEGYISERIPPSTPKECASELCGFRKEHARRAPLSDNKSRKTSRLLNTLEGKMCRGIIERQSDCELCISIRCGHRAGASVHKEKPWTSRRRVSKEYNDRVVEHSIGKTQQGVL